MDGGVGDAELGEDGELGGGDLGALGEDGGACFGLGGAGADVGFDGEGITLHDL